MRGILRSPVNSPHKASDAELWSFLCLPITFRATSSGSSEPLPSNSSHPLPSGSSHSLASDSSHSLASGSSHFLPKGSSKLPKCSSNLPPCGSLNILPSSSSSLKPIGNPNLPSDRPNLPSCLKTLQMTDQNYKEETYQASDQDHNQNKMDPTGATLACRKQKKKTNREIKFSFNTNTQQENTEKGQKWKERQYEN